MEYYLPIRRINYWYKQEHEWISKVLGWVKEAVHKRVQFCMSPLNEVLEQVKQIQRGEKNQNSSCLWG